MSNIESYNKIVEELQNRITSNQITLEFAEKVNDLAYNKYISEGFLFKKKKSDKDKLKDDIEKLKKLRADGKISDLDFTKKVSEIQSKYTALTAAI